MMKYPITLLLTVAMMFSCGSDHENGGDSKLDELTTQKDSLSTLMADLTEKLSDVEMQIAKLDTTKKRIKVTAQRVQVGKYANYFEVYGDVESRDNIRITAETSGEITAILVNEGDEVKKDDVLMRIDAEVVRKNAEEVESQLTLARDIYNRQKRLWKKNIGSEVQYLEAENRVKSLEKRLGALEKQLDMAVVRAPVSGTVDKIFPREGETAVPGMQLARVINLQNMYIEADVSERYTRNVTRGKRVKVVFPEVGIELDTVITRVGKYINPGNRTFEITINIDNPGEMLKPNLMGKVLIKSTEVDSAITASVRTVQETPEGDHFVYILKPLGKNTCRVERADVEVGSSYGGRTHILSGLTGNELLVDKGSRRVRTGQIVELID